MSALDRLDGSFPHGLPAGFDQGCRGAGECPNHGTELPICREAWARYRSDWSYRKRVDRGLSPVEILAEERAEDDAQRVVVVEARQAAVKAEQARLAAEERARVREERLAAREKAKAEREQARVDRDRAKAEQKITEEKLVDAKPLTVRDARAAVRAADLVVERAQQALRDAERAAAGAGARLDALLAERAPKPRREVQPHGTNASYARGCRTPEGCPNFGTGEPTCYEAMRAYHREYMRKRRVAGITPEQHGTPYGYQLGCKEREGCPATPSCADASLAEEARRRRERGVPERALMVPAEPVRAHVRALMAAGVPYLTVAERAGVSKSSTQTLLYGRSGRRKGPLPGLISAANAERLMAVTA